MGTADAKLAGNMYATPGYTSLWLPSPVRCRVRAPGPDKFIRKGSSGFRKL